MVIALSGGYPDSAPDLVEDQWVPDSGQTPEPVPGRDLSQMAPLASAAPADARDPAPAKGIAASERLATAADEARAYEDETDFDAGLVRESFAHIAASPGPAMEYFFAQLFVRNPEMRAMFPLAMRQHMETMFTALERIVWSIDNPGQLTAFLGQLGRDHRKFGVRDRHYESVVAAFLETSRHFCGHYWTHAIQEAWEAAFSHACAVMMAAARDDAHAQPPWWIGEIVGHDLRCPDLAVITIRPDQPLSYIPGQYLAVQVPRWPRLWRNFSIANAPRRSGLIDLHVRALPGGLVSGSLVHHSAPGDTVVLGPARGKMTMQAGPGRDLLCIAGGTGLAPIKAIIEGVIGASAAGGPPRKIGLLFGARTEQDLYDLAALRELESACPALTVTPVVSDQPHFPGLKGTLPEAAARYASCEGKDIFLSGPAAMVRATVSALADRAGTEQIRYDPSESAA
jgi:NAD(P)H-flavin reductase/hemoglobin-like flavoprotein